MTTGDQSMSEDSRTRKPGKVSLHLLRFEDALKGLLKTKPNRPTEAEPSKRASEREVRQTPEND
jgi:hypothetical protein